MGKEKIEYTKGELLIINLYDKTLEELRKENKILKLKLKLIEEELYKISLLIKCKY